MTRVAFKVIGAGAYAKMVHTKLPYSSIEDGVVVVWSRLESTALLNEHLVWLWGMVQPERRVLKTAVAGGARIVCECIVPRGRVQILPNGAEMLHLLGAELLLEAK